MRFLLGMLGRAVSLPMVLLCLSAAWGATVADPVQTGGTLKMVMRGEPKTFDPFLVEDESSGMVRYMTGGVLIRLNRKTQKMEPALASSWTISEAGRRITFHIREGVKFSDGTPFTAGDVAATLKRLTDAKHPTPSGDSFGGDGGAAVVEVLPGNKVSLQFSKPRAGVEMLFDAVIVTSLTSPMKEKAALGPFFVKEYKPGQYVQLERNPYYWKSDAQGRRLPYLEGVRLEIQTNREIELLRFRRGELHIINQLDAEMFERLQSEKGKVVLDGGPSLEAEFLWFNQNPASPVPAHKRLWFQSTAFRVAVSEAVNRDDISRIVYRGKAQPAAGPVSPANKFWFNQGLKPLAYAPDKALRRLQAEGFSKRGTTLIDKSGHPVEFSLITNSGSKIREKIAAMVQQDLAKIGIRMNIVTLDFPSLIERIVKNWDYEACLLGLVNVQLDPNSEMNVWMSSAANHQWNPNQKSPATQWEAELDKNMLAQASTIDASKRKIYYDQVQRIVVEQSPFVYLINRNTLAASSNAVKNLSISTLYPQTFWNIDELFLSNQGVRK
jgi:peptide/nickel transport system substrate-binding protein